MQHRPWFVLPPAMDTYYRRFHADYSVLPPLMPGCEPTNEIQAMGLTYPQNDPSALCAARNRRLPRRVVLQAAYHDADATIYWHLDNTTLGSTTTISQMGVAPSPGPHRLVLVDNYGRRLEKIIAVIDDKK
jgi:penicillin-binding protein 1C